MDTKQRDENNSDTQTKAEQRPKVKREPLNPQYPWIDPDHCALSKDKTGDIGW